MKEKQAPNFKPSDIEDLRVLENIKKGNANAFASIVKKYSTHTYNKYLLALNYDSAQAEDLLQELFIKVFRKIDCYVPDYTFNTWFSTVASNHLIDYLRRQTMLYSKVAMVSLDAIIQTSYNKSAAADDILQGELVGKSLGNVPDDDLIENYDELSANEHELENMERADELFNHISNMRTQDKEILQLYYVDGKKYKEIAQILGITMSSVKVRILRAKESLRKIQAMVGNQPINLI